MALENEVNMSSALWIPLHKAIDLQRWVHQGRDGTELADKPLGPDDKPRPQNPPTGNLD